jgi:SAM-dependent methyltransferase
MIETIEYKGKQYPKLQTTGHASRFALPFFKEFCKGNNGVEVGCNRLQWAFNPDAILVDPEITRVYHALNLPVGKYDWIASSHMLEHIECRWQDVIEYWMTFLNPGGVIFLYLPNCDEQEYWAMGNKKHVHHTTPYLFRWFCEHGGYKHFVSSGADLNASFYVVIEKP